MNGPPEDVAGECNARLEVGDDYGDNVSTFRCSLEPGHEGPHKEEFDHYSADNPVCVTWMKDAREEEE
jgi:hypothetical protein